MADFFYLLVKAHLHVQFQNTILKLANPFLEYKIYCLCCKPAGLMQNNVKSDSRVIEL